MHGPKKITKSILDLAIFSEDKTIRKLELNVTIISAVTLILGILLIILKPHLWIITSQNFIVLGVLLILISIMYIPCIGYKILVNLKSRKKKQ